MLKKTLILAAVLVGMGVATAPQADAGIFVRRIAPVRRVAYRAVLPPYPVARAVAPVYRPYYRPVPYGYGYRGYGYGGGFGYGPGVSVGVGLY